MGGKWSGKMQERKCTDCYCTFVYIAFWTWVVGILCAAFWLGDPTLQRVFYGTDYNGHTCGVDHSHENGPNLLDRKRIIYPRVMQDVLMHAYKFATDAEGINEIVENPTQLADFVTDFHPFGVCIEECPSGGDYVCTYEWDKKVDKKAIQECYMKDGLELAADYLLSKVDGLGGKNCEEILANCFPTPVDNQDYFFRCLPLYRTGKEKIEECVEWYSDNNTDKTVHENYDCLAVKVTELKETIKPAKGDFLLDVVNDQVQIVNNILDDFFKAKFVIITVGFIGAVVLSFVWLVILRFFAVVIVWASIVLVYILCGAAVLLCYFKSDLVSGTDIGNLMGSLDSAQAAVAAGMGQQSGSVLENVTAPMDFLFDSQHAQTWKYVAYVSTGVYVIFIIFGLIMLKKVVVAIKIIVETTNAIKDMPLIMLWPLFPSAFILVMLVYWLYTAMFIGSMGAVKPQHVEALALTKLGNLTSPTLFNNATIVDTKAFTPLDLQPAFQIYNFFMVMWTMGLINAISFILASIRLVRFIMMYLEKRTRAAQRNNKCVKTLFKVVHCMLFLFDRCLKYLARQAYIMVAMYGYNFCKASIMAVMLIIKRPASRCCERDQPIRDVFGQTRGGCVVCYCGLHVADLLPGFPRRKRTFRLAAGHRCHRYLRFVSRLLCLQHLQCGC